MQRVQTGPLAGFAGVLALLAALHVLVDLPGAALAVGVGSGVVVVVLLGRALDHPAHAGHAGRSLGPADLVTLVRAVLACGVAALVAGAVQGAGGLGWLVGIATVALVLDGVDGHVARRTGTVSELGARFDMEVDAFLILVLSVQVAGSVGWWVIVIGAARYLLLAAGTVLPWLHATLPPRRWCKVVAAGQGVVLVTAAADVLPLLLTRVLLAVALALLGESFGREVRDLWRLRSAPSPDAEPELARAA